MKRNVVSALAFCVFFVISQLSCQLPDTGLTITITDVGWVIENIDPSFWNPVSTSPEKLATTCFYNWFIVYSGDAIALSDIQSARIYAVNEDWHWDIIPGNNFNAANKVIGGWGRWFWGTTNNHRLPIGDFQAEVILTNGHTTTCNTSFPAPGSTSTNGFRYVYAEDYAGAVGGDFTPMLKRATILAYTKGVNDITIGFSVDDGLVYNGYVVFYNTADPDGYVGATNYFRDWDTENINTNLLSDLNIDGSLNTVEISDDEITYDTGKNFADIDQFIVVLTDGQQYVSVSSATYDCLSRSVKTNF